MIFSKSYSFFCSPTCSSSFISFSIPSFLKQTCPPRSCSILRLNSTQVSFKTSKRCYSTTPPPSPFVHPRYHRTRFNNLTGMYYAGAFLVMFLGASYAAVPLYRLFCSAVGIGGTTYQAQNATTTPSSSSSSSSISSTTTNTTTTLDSTSPTSFSSSLPLSSFKKHQLTPLTSVPPFEIQFVSTTSRSLPWTFTPCQPDLKVQPGETALAFYTAHNKTNQPITGIATYNVVPPQAAPYFNKIQCFCFEEQQLGPNETVDMPIFFFIDPAIEEDPIASSIRKITLSYTFFKAKTPLS